MIRLVLNHLLSRKNLIIIFIYLAFLLSINYLLLPNDVAPDEVILNSNYYFNYYNELLLELIKIIIPISLVLLLTDHDHNYINNITTYIGRSKVIKSKIIIYLYIIILLILISTLNYYLALKISKNDCLVKVNFYHDMTFLLIDNILMFLLILLLVRKDKKIIGYLIIMLYYVLGFYLNIESKIAIFYVFPINISNFKNYTNTLSYAFIYIIILIVLNIYTYINEDFK
jgi:hypothetical protein